MQKCEIYNKNQFLVDKLKQKELFVI